MLWLVIGFVAAVLVLSWLWTGFIGAEWTPTPMPKVRKMLSMAGVGPKDVVYDLGCGDGRIIIAAVQEFGARSVGIEADPLRFLVTWLRIKIKGLDHQTRVVWGNFFSCDMSAATVVTLFLTRRANRRLRTKLEKELQAGTRVICYCWPFKEWKPKKIDPTLELYLYEI